MRDYEILSHRASIRKFTKEPITKEDVRAILEAGFNAPSALNLRPYHFIVIDDRTMLDHLSTTTRWRAMLKDAPMAIAIVGDYNINETYEFIMNDTSACIENMLLMIDALDLGGVWLGQRRKDDEIVNKVLNLPPKMFVSGFIALGHKVEDKIQKDRFDEKKVHHNVW